MMELTGCTTVTINEDSLIDYLHKTYPTYSLDEMLDYLSTDEGEVKLISWILDNTNNNFEYFDDYSYGELLDYIEYNF